MSQIRESSWQKCREASECSRWPQERHREPERPDTPLRHEEEQPQEGELGGKGGALHPDWGEAPASALLRVRCRKRGAMLVLHPSKGVAALTPSTCE